MSTADMMVLLPPQTDVSSTPQEDSSAVQTPASCEFGTFRCAARRLGFETASFSSILTTRQNYAAPQAPEEFPYRLRRCDKCSLPMVPSELEMSSAPMEIPNTDPKVRWIIQVGGTLPVYGSLWSAKSVCGS